VLESLLADFVLLLHLAFIVFILLGGLAVAKSPRLLWLHLPAALWGVLIELMGWVCPLTPLENWLRRGAGEQGYTETFVEHYILPLVYPAGLTRNIQLVLAIIVVVVNVLVYSWLIRRSKGLGGMRATSYRRNDSS